MFPGIKQLQPKDSCLILKLQFSEAQQINFPNMLSLIDFQESSGLRQRSEVTDATSRFYYTYPVRALRHAIDAASPFCLVLLHGFETGKNDIPFGLKTIHSTRFIFLPFVLLSFFN